VSKDRNKSNCAVKRFKLEQLEPRTLYSADPISAGLYAAPDILEDLHSNDQSLYNAALQVSDDRERAEQLHTQAIAEQQGRIELIFIDSATPDYQLLIQDLLANQSADRTFEIIRIDSDDNGLQIISDTLATQSNVDAVHLISHGSDGNVNLGNVALNHNTLPDFEAAITQWGNAFTTDGDLLIYGCDFAATEDGKALAARISALAEVDVASSDDSTGGVDRNANWVLEQITGNVETSVPFSDQLQDTYQRSLASSITVTTTLDVVDSDTTSFDSLLLDYAAGNDISLREAIMAANAQPGADTIELPAGAYELNIIGNSVSGDNTGDHDITSDVTINGDGSGTTSITAIGLNDRVIEIHSGAKLTVNDLTIEDGSKRSGSGIYNAGTLVTNNVVVQNNLAGNLLGGALWNQGTANLNFTEIQFNSANSGGGIYNSSTGDITFTSTTVLGNTSTGQGAGLNNTGTAEITGSAFLDNEGLNGGAIANDKGTVTIVNSTFNGNDASNATGGAVFNKGGDTIIRYSTFAENSAKNTGAAVFEQGGSVTIGSSIFSDNTITTPWGGPDIDGISVSEGHNIIKSTNLRSSDSQSTDQIGVDPLLLPLGFYNSPTKTHALDPASPAINNGGGSPPAVDQRGVARDVLADSGAHEGPSTLPVANIAPVITPSLTTTNYSENTSLLIDSAISVTDSDSADFDTGNLTITSSGFKETADQVYIIPVGTGAGEIDVNGASVLYEGILIGTWSGGVGNSPLQIDFNAASSLAAVNALTQSIGFTIVSENPAPTARTLTYEISDGDGRTSIDADININIVVSNDPPAINSPANNVTVNEDTILAFSPLAGNAITITDEDTNSNLKLTLTVSSGALALSSTPAALNSTVTFTGTQTEINTQLDGLLYQPNANYNGNDTLQITIEDQDTAGSLSSTENINILVNPVYDPPSITAPVSQSVIEDGSIVFESMQLNSLTVAAPDTTSPEVTLVVSNGTLEIVNTAGTTITGNNSSAVMLTGSVPDLNASLEGLVYSPSANYAGPDMLEVEIADLGQTGSGSPGNSSSQVAITVDAVSDAPMGQNNTIVVNEDTSKTVLSTDFGFSDTVDGDFLAAVRITKIPSQGSLTLAGNSVTNNQLISIVDINNGDLKFTDAAEDMNAAKYGFGWGTVMADMNLDGLEDMLAAQNYARFPANNLLQHYPGKILQNYGDKFQPVEKASGGVNTLFGIAPIVSDFNGDGWPDLVWANLDGESLAYMNKGGDRNWIKVRLPNTARSLNARVTVKASNGLTQTKQLLTSQGLGSDQGRDLIFGLGDAESATSVTVEFQNGVTRSFDAPKNGSLITASAE